MSESFREQLSRLEQMAEDGQETWDLSENDVAAIRAVLADRQRMATKLNAMSAPVSPSPQGQERRDLHGQLNSLIQEWHEKELEILRASDVFSDRGQGVYAKQLAARADGIARCIEGLESLLSSGTKDGHV